MGLGGSKRSAKPQGEPTPIAIHRRHSRTNAARFISASIAAQRFLPDYFFVTETLSSLFVDEDGDAANEFYCETFEGSKRSARLVKKIDNLKPQGCVKYSIPRLHPDVPFVMWEVKNG